MHSSSWRRARRDLALCTRLVIELQSAAAIAAVALAERRLLRVAVDVRFRRRGRHERHVVERGHEHAAVERPEVEEPLELESPPAAPRGRCAAGRHEVVLGPAAQAGHVPGHAGRRSPRSRPLQRAASGIIRANAASVRTSPSVARTAASDRA